MDKATYERTKEEIADTFEAGIELLEKARDQKLQALEVLWMSSPEFRARPDAQSGTGEGRPNKKPETGDKGASPQRPGEVDERVAAAIEQLGETVTQPEVTAKLKELGPPIPRGTVGAALRRMAESGDKIREKEKGRGRRATVYEKI